MRKCYCTVIYSSYPILHIYDITIITKNNHNINLLSDENVSREHHYKYSDFHELYSDVLGVLKNNNFIPDKWNNYGATWYNIDFIDISFPAQYGVKFYPYKGV